MPGYLISIWWMCSVLLILLIFIVIFDTLQDSVPFWLSEKALSQRKSCSKAFLVSPPYGCDYTWTNCTSNNCESTCIASFEGSFFHQEDSSAHHDARALAVALCPVSENQQEDSGRVRALPGPLVHRLKAQHSTEKFSAGFPRSSMGSMGRNRPFLELEKTVIEVTIAPKRCKGTSQQPKCCWITKSQKSQRKRKKYKRTVSERKRVKGWQRFQKQRRQRF